MTLLLKRFFPLMGALVLLASCACPEEETMQELINRAFNVAREQYVAMDATLTETEYPRSYADGKLITSDNTWWCSGYYPGSLWYIYKYTSDEAVKELAHKNTLKNFGIWETVNNHDLGFQMDCSYGLGYEFTQNPDYLEPLKLGAAKLASRFSPATGLIRSWDFVKPGNDWSYPVIIDNMMNLEYLMEASKAFGIPEYETICRSHADNTLANHFRPDWSCYHLVDYDINDGHIRGKQTVQGYSNDSMWSRGEAWGLYGYTMMYRETSELSYLDAAENMARLVISKLPEDGIPYWDFDAPGIPDEMRDSSAGAIMASAFVELSTLTQDKELGAACLATAERQLRTLASDEYLAAPGENGHFILKHAVGSMPEKAEVDVPLTYGDYYFIEALYRFSCL